MIENNGQSAKIILIVSILRSDKEKISTPWGTHLLQSPKLLLRYVCVSLPFLLVIIPLVQFFLHKGYCVYGSFSQGESAFAANLLLSFRAFHRHSAHINIE